MPQELRAMLSRQEFSCSKSNLHVVGRGGSADTHTIECALQSVGAERHARAAGRRALSAPPNARGSTTSSSRRARHREQKFFRSPFRDSVAESVAGAGCRAARRPRRRSDRTRRPTEKLLAKRPALLLLLDPRQQRRHRSEPEFRPTRGAFVLCNKRAVGDTAANRPASSAKRANVRYSPLA
jgi:hypothetical protein